MSAGQKNRNGIGTYDRKNGMDVWSAEPNFEMEQYKNIHRTKNVNYLNILGVGTYCNCDYKNIMPDDVLFPSGGCRIVEPPPLGWKCYCKYYVSSNNMCVPYPRALIYPRQS